MIFISQNLRSIGPVIRKQTDLWVLFKNPNKTKLVEQIYEEVSGSGVSIEQFLEYFDYICKQDYGSLIISCHKDDPIGYAFTVHECSTSARDSGNSAGSTVRDQQVCVPPALL